MKAWILPEPRGVGALRIVDLPDPVPAPREVVLTVEYAALNPADRYLAEGLYPAKPPLPHVLGRDGVGTIVKADPDAGLHVGDKRLILRGETGVTRHGTFAERVAVSADSLVPVPQGWTDEQAAGAPLVYLTAYQSLTAWGELPP